MPTELDAPLRAVTRALLDECDPIRLDEIVQPSTPVRRTGLWIGALVMAAAAATVAVVVTLARPDRTVQTVDTTPIETIPETVSAPPATLSTITRTLQLDEQGDDVKALQQRLIDLHFDPGPVDGFFGQATQQAVWAYERLVLGVPSGQATGAVTPAMWTQLQGDPTVSPRRPNEPGTHVEIYLPEQVLVVFRDGSPILITHMSSGSGETWTELIALDPGTDENPGTDPIEKVVTGTSITPGGVYSFKRFYDQGDGWLTEALGRMYKPAYFDYGVAVYGSSNVPDMPASHGGVRIPMHIADHFSDLVERGDQVFVFDGQNEPEYYGGGVPPPFDTEARYVVVPDLSGMATADALVAAQTSGLRIEIAEAPVPSGDARDGRVIVQSPAGGTGVPAGSTVNVSVGAAPPG